MNPKYILFLITLFLWGYSCSQTNKTVSNSDSNEINFKDLNLKTGKTIVQTVCITCHDPKKSESDRIAPPLELVKRHYLSQSNNEREFILLVTDFIINPTEAEARMHDDVEKLGLMDPLGYSKKEIQSVAMYLYRTELERPDWVD